MEKRMKKFLCALLACGLLLSLAACGSGGSAGNKDPENSGTHEAAGAAAETVNGPVEDQNENEDSPTEQDGLVHIKTPEELAAFAERVNNGETALSAVLDADLDMSGICGPSAGSFTPIMSFEGEFDGGDHIIANLYCVQAKGTAALFDSLKGTVKNLRLENAVVESAEGYAAGVAGGLSGRIENCSVSGSVKAYKYAGGIVIDLYRDSVVSDCVNEAEVCGGYFDEEKHCLKGAAAGIAAWPREGGVITGCVNRGAVTGNGNMAAGIAGYCEKGHILIESCVNEGSVQGRSGIAQLGSWGQNENYVGGIAGYAGENTVVTKCINNGSVFGTGFVGGIAAASGNFIINCANHGRLEASEGGQVSGIATEAIKGLLNCYNTGEITCDQYACGIGASARAVEINLYNYGTIICTSNEGVLTDAFPWSSGGAVSGLLNTYAKENCIVVPDGSQDKFSIQAGNGASDEDFTGGTILNALNEAVEGINGDLTIDFGGFQDDIEEMKEDENFELSAWVAGPDGLPRFDWE